MHDIATKRWRLGLWTAFVLVVGLILVLLQRAYEQNRLETFYAQRGIAEQVVQRIDDRLVELIRTETGRPVEDYDFAVPLAGQPNTFRQSPIADLPETLNVPGLVSYFQVDAQDALTTPLLPSGVDDSPVNLAVTQAGRRRDTQLQVRQILESADNKLDDAGGEAAPKDERDAGLYARIQNAAVAKSSAPKRSQQLSELDYDVSFSEKFEDRPAVTAPAESNAKRVSAERKEIAEQRSQPSILRQFKQLGRSEPSIGSVASTPESTSVRASLDALAEEETPYIADRPTIEEILVTPLGDSNTATPRPAPEVAADMFDLTIMPFQLTALDDAHYVLYRPVWRAGEQFIQGLIFNTAELFDELVWNEMVRSGLPVASRVVVAFQGEVADEFSIPAGGRSAGQKPDAASTLLLEAALAHPFSELQLVFSVSDVQPTSVTLFWLWPVLLLVLALGFVLIDRYLMRLVALNQQQRNFVAAVSHEMKTPLTSIRMYGEMLLAGWTEEANRRTYYEYIHDESERLSRLIDNVLRLAKITNEQDRLNLRSVGVAELMDNIRSKIGAQVDQAGGHIEYDIDAECARSRLWVDADAVLQMVINLVDNAIKFSRSETKPPRVEVRFESGATADRVALAVRDFGPGIAAKEQKRIFKLFYRSGDELTRETSGTGIGLALVAELAREMDAEISVRNAQPGAEFCIVFKTIDEESTDAHVP